MKQRSRNFSPTGFAARSPNRSLAPSWRTRSSAPSQRLTRTDARRTHSHCPHFALRVLLSQGERKGSFVHTPGPSSFSLREKVRMRVSRTLSLAFFFEVVLAD